MLQALHWPAGGEVSQLTTALRGRRRAKGSGQRAQGGERRAKSTERRAKGAGHMEEKVERE
jgi:hypothetical protein